MATGTHAAPEDKSRMSTVGDRDALLSALRNAPADDEAESDAERAASERARGDIDEGETLSQDEIRRKLRRE